MVDYDDSRMSQRHTLRNFDSELHAIAGLIVEMGGLVEKQVVDAAKAWTSRDIALAISVAPADAHTDSLQHDIEQRAVAAIARHQPVASDLRELIGAMRISNDLERVGDLAKNIAKRMIVLQDDLPPVQTIRGIDHMNELVLAQLKAVLNAYVRSSVPEAVTVWLADVDVDALCNSVSRELLTYMMEDPRDISSCIHLLFCAKNIERMGDHATNIAEAVYYIVNGVAMVENRPKGEATPAIHVM